MGRKTFIIDSGLRLMGGNKFEDGDQKEINQGSLSEFKK